ncbi:MFS-type transporter SLC18B1-like [Corticium candelabrum]|uniref:MFS-type transporter SLC18B1-like n=1 Tax=Corticium candelabrum TaxID=121492 RepID=UPI002E264971|nr:MFS-type transporter SLC18B1-like [Corticium candelabrum]
MNYLCIYLPSPFFPQVAAEKKGSKADTEVGVMVGSLQLSAFIVSVFVGGYLDRLGARFLATSGVFLVGGCTVLFGFLEYVKEWSPFIELSIAIRFVMGVGEAAFHATSIALLLGMFPTRAGTMWGLAGFVETVGFVCGAPLGGMLYDIEGFYFPFVVIGGILLSFTPLLWYLLSDIHSLTEGTHDDQSDDDPFDDDPSDDDSSDDDPSDDDQVMSVWQLLKIPSIVLMLLNVFACYATLALFDTSLFAMYLYKEFGWNVTVWSEAHIGLIFLIAGGACVILCLVIGVVVDATYPRIVMIIGLLITGCGMMIIGPSFEFSFLSPKPWCVYVAMVLLGLGVSMITISGGPNVSEIAISRGYKTSMALNGAISGLVLAAIFLSGTLGVPIAGFLTAALNFHISSFLGFASFLLLIITIVDTIVKTVIFC